MHHKLNKPLFLMVLFSYLIIPGLYYYPDITKQRQHLEIEGAAFYAILMAFFLFLFTFLVFMLSVIKSKDWFSDEKKLSTIILLLIYAVLPIYYFARWIK